MDKIFAIDSVLMFNSFNFINAEMCSRMVESTVHAKWES